MGRITEYIDFINRKIKPDAMTIRFDYTHLTITEKIEKSRKKHLKKIKNEQEDTKSD